VNLWEAVFLMIIVATDGSAAVSYITRFTEESFATLISLIFIVEAINKMFSILNAQSYSRYTPEVSGVCVGI
jgi:hypothetical protein